MNLTVNKRNYFNLFIINRYYNVNGRVLYNTVLEIIFKPYFEWFFNLSVQCDSFNCFNINNNTLRTLIYLNRDKKY